MRDRNLDVRGTHLGADHTGRKRRKTSKTVVVRVPERKILYDWFLGNVSALLCEVVYRTRF